MKTLKVLKHKHFCGILVTVLATGCAQRGPLNFSQAGPDPTQACFAQMKADQSYEALRARSSGPGGQPTLEMRASRERVTEAEKAVLSKWAAAYQSCTQSGQAYRAQNLPPAHAALADLLGMRVIAATARLYAGETTWGQYLAERDVIDSEARAGWASASQAHAQAEAAKASADAARGLALMQAAQAARPQTPVYQIVPTPPLNTPINCTTMPMGAGWTNTRCQ